MTILGIDTCDKTAAAAIMRDGEVLAEAAFMTGRTHSQVILPLAKRCLSDAGLTLNDMDAFAAITGPGSYTGLRIGISAVQGICYALGKPCIGVSALEALAANVPVMPQTTVFTIMHARQDLYYFAEYANDKTITEPCIMNSSDITRYMSCRSANVIPIGDTDGIELTANCIALPKVYSRRTAVSLCAAAMHHDPISADQLLPDYLQITKAEKDLIEK